MVEILLVLTLIAAISTAGLLAVHLMRARSAEREAREELSRGLATFSQTLSTQMGATASVQNAQFETLRSAVEHRLERIQQDNSAKLEQMRQTVDEKLHATLEKRLSESFKQVSDRLEVLTRRNGAFIVNHATSRAGVTSHLRGLCFLSLRNQTVHVDVDRGLEETGFAAVVVFDRGVTRVVVDHLGELCVARMIDVQLFRIC